MEASVRHGKPSWRMIIKGQLFGREWSGRIDLWAYTKEPPKIGDVVRLSHMEVRKLVAKRRWERQTLEHGIVSGWRQIPISELEEGDELVEETRRYIRLDPTLESPLGCELVWVTAHSKTTLKGFGRQYSAGLSGSPIWYQEVRGGARNGRFNTTAWLAVVDTDNPVIHSHSEDGSIEQHRYPPKEEVN